MPNQNDPPASDLNAHIRRATSVIRTFAKRKPAVGIILGTGLGQLANAIKQKIVIPYADIPGFPQTTVATHAGQLVIGRLLHAHGIVGIVRNGLGGLSQCKNRPRNDPLESGRQYDGGAEQHQ